jgi:hypothetical protein
MCKHQLANAIAGAGCIKKLLKLIADAASEQVSSSNCIKKWLKLIADAASEQVSSSNSYIYIGLWK